MKLADMHSLLRNRGLRATPQRLAVAELLFEKPTHETPQTIHETLKGRFPSISPNTIYLTLAHFEKSGLVTRLDVNGRTVFDSNTTHHDHAFCQKCKKLIDISTSSGCKLPPSLADWDLKHENRIYSGLCPACIS